MDKRTDDSAAVAAELEHAVEHVAAKRDRLLASLTLIAGIGAPSTLAVDCATRGNMTLIGFLRPDRLNIYSGPARIA